MMRNIGDLEANVGAGEAIRYLFLAIGTGEILLPSAWNYYLSSSISPTFQEHSNCLEIFKSESLVCGCVLRASDWRRQSIIRYLPKRKLGAEFP